MHDLTTQKSCFNTMWRGTSSPLTTYKYIITDFSLPDCTNAVVYCCILSMLHPFTVLFQQAALNLPKKQQQLGNRSIHDRQLKIFSYLWSINHTLTTQHSQMFTYAQMLNGWYEQKIQAFMKLLKVYTHFIQHLQVLLYT